MPVALVLSDLKGLVMGFSDSATGMLHFRALKMDRRVFLSGPDEFLTLRSRVMMPAAALFPLATLARSWSPSSGGLRKW